MQFSHRLMDSGVDLKDLSQVGFPTKILFWETPAASILDYSEKDETRPAFFVPIQFYYKHALYKSMLTNELYKVIRW